MSEYATRVDAEVFEASRAMFEAVVGELAGQDCAQFSHAELEELLTTRARELMRQLLQDHLDYGRNVNNGMPDVTDAEQWPSAVSRPCTPAR